MLHNSKENDFGLINFLLKRSLIYFLQYSKSSGFIWIGLAFVGICFSLKYFSYDNETICCFLFQNAFGIEE